ncbi:MULTISPECIES: hypothetical protein [unclassified Moraxella]|uniref:DUF968 domain-containing protein n=1 Tax=unclassified Moraxella TaxID=2685852 RepID=UPI002B413F87|nr:MULTISPECIES: hypothetical protein [unclassified Moraxella]
MKRLEKLRALPCCQCNAPPPSHACHANWQEFGKGKGIKASDAYTIPLCHRCHRELDTYQGRNREQAKAWFLRKLDFVNKVLDEQENPTDAIF